jgi:putative tricarboxylic transport membrane protein
MLKFIFSRPILLLRSSIIGVIVGLLPGAGASIASFISYGEAQRVSKEPETFGQGNPEGVIASETANNAMVGGSLMPLLTFGIPGSPSAAVLFGALAMNGMIPGPRLMVENTDVVYPFMLSFFPAVICMYVIGTIGARFFPKVLEIKTTTHPSVLGVALIGSYAVGSAARPGVHRWLRVLGL